LYQLPQALTNTYQVHFLTTSQITFYRH